MKKYWKTRDKKFLNDILNLAKTKYFVHPIHTDWMDQYVINWVLKNSGIVNNIKTSISNEHDHGFDKSKIKAKTELDEMFPIKKGN